MRRTEMSVLMATNVYGVYHETQTTLNRKMMGKRRRVMRRWAISAIKTHRLMGLGVLMNNLNMTIIILLCCIGCSVIRINLFICIKGIRRGGVHCIIEQHALRAIFNLHETCVFLNASQSKHLFHIIPSLKAFCIVIEDTCIHMYQIQHAFGARPCGSNG